MSIQPEGENFRDAVRWISCERQDHPDMPLIKLIDKASIKFNLSPIEADSLSHILSNPTECEE